MLFFRVKCAHGLIERPVVKESGVGCEEAAPDCLASLGVCVNVVVGAHAHWCCPPFCVGFLLCF